ncbi:Cof-type HAD-IIB family hydrolase [Lederbergia lenta]|uniref:HAD-superfamily hydrolase n=1 Tax=Lederbergia lenta TaxID=1467 RepID=A0A2X4WD02_LEDLE|nr:Cof-type HAD-IIB family hydrolase [Lederbergia lenta]MCM3110529.1 Cof-type HAD-IIB family hydrolase [Lederbergia lenta]MEC2323905.1 Cof-type HAD-IIB family hydrolase [Lederbergia lenta]SQI61051.1 HAD-superfamily hydrolase [Lederbergia lenta]
MVYKMLVLNIDGTLVQDNGRIHKLTREAIAYAQNKGITVTLATAKNFPAAKRMAKTLKIDSHIIAHQGAYIASELNKPIYVNRIHEKIAREIVALLESFSCQIKLVHEQFTLGNKVKLPENMVGRVFLQSTNRFSYSEQFVEIVSEKLLDEPVSPPKIEVHFDDQQSVEDAAKAIAEMYNEVDCIFTEECKMEIVGANVSKLQGVKYVCERLDIKRDEVVAIGAGLDDLSLIEWAGLGVSMGNAPAIVQAAADWLTRSNNDQGVAYMVKEHFRKQQPLSFLKKINVLK